MDIATLKRLETTELYALALEAQAKLNRLDAAGFLEALPSWDRVRSILEAGCGPGALARELRDVVAHRSYLGIDLEPAFIARARAGLKGELNFSFQVADLHELDRGNFDVILVYAVLQHVPSVPAALDRLSRLLEPQGSIVILDTRSDIRNAGETIVTDPAIPALSEMSRGSRKGA